MAHRRSLDQLEAEIRETRARLAALLARADRDYAFRPILHALERGAGREIAAPQPQPQAAPAGEPEHGAHMTRLALPAALFGFALAFLALHRRRPGGGDKGTEERLSQ